MKYLLCWQYQYVDVYWNVLTQDDIVRGGPAPGSPELHPPSHPTPAPALLICKVREIMIVNKWPIGNIQHIAKLIWPGNSTKDQGVFKLRIQIQLFLRGTYVGRAQF